MSDDPYVYPGTRVLKNKLEIRDVEALDTAERRITAVRARQGVPAGDFDLKHLRAIHHHLFQDVYDWAGQVRSVEITKGGSQFQFRKYIETGMADVHRRIVGNGYLRGLKADAFAAEAGPIMGDVNYVHPFREGNGRTQLLYLEQLARQAGHRINLRRLERDAWIEASKRAHQADYGPMSQCIGRTIEPGRERGRDRSGEDDQSR